VAVFGVSFGVLARSAGMGPLAPVVMSAIAFAGSAQFAAVSVLAAGGGVVAAVAAAVLLNARYGPMGLAAAPAFRGRRARRLAEAQLMVDEAWALSSDRGRFDRHVLIGAGLLLYVAWVAGTAAGVLAGQALGDPKDLGLDAAFPALFLALLAGQLGSAQARAAAVAGAAIALVLVPLAPPGVPIIAAAAGCLVGLRR
jgi:4-azaleucine resistance transporter AzlC